MEALSHAESAYGRIGDATARLTSGRPSDSLEHP